MAAIGGILRPLGTLLGRTLGPRLATLSPAAWIAVALAAVSLLVGYALGWPELVFVGVTIVVALVVCSVFLLGRSEYGVRIGLVPPRVEVGEKAEGLLAVRNAGTRRLLPSRMELPVGDGMVEFPIPGLAAGEEREDLFHVSTAHRGVVVAGPAVSVRGDQLGLLRRTLRWADPVELFVHPRTVPLAPSAAGLVRDLEGQVTKKITSNDLSFHALRDYEYGDEYRNIHWRTTARVGHYMVRQFEETRRSQLTIFHAESGAHYADDEEFELAVSVTASIGAQVIRDGTQMSVVADSLQLRSHSPTALLDDSCRLGMIAAPPTSARDQARAAMRRLPPPSVLIVVAGSGMTTADFRSIELLAPVDAAVMAFSVRRGATPALQPVGRLRIATVGELGDLPKILRRAAI
jgi:uncharacterized protein (DUF58 family)